MLAFLLESALGQVPTRKHTTWRTSISLLSDYNLRATQSVAPCGPYCSACSTPRARKNPWPDSNFWTPDARLNTSCPALSWTLASKGWVCFSRTKSQAHSFWMISSKPSSIAWAVKSIKVGCGFTVVESCCWWAVSAGANLPGPLLARYYLEARLALWVAIACFRSRNSSQEKKQILSSRASICSAPARSFFISKSSP